MERSLMTLLAVLFAIVVYAGKQVEMFDDKGAPISHGSGVPVVETDGDLINIKSDTLLVNVTIVIRDMDGTVLHKSIQTIDNVGVSLFVPSVRFDNQISTIDLYHEHRHLKGFIE